MGNRNLNLFCILLIISFMPSNADGIPKGYVLKILSGNTFLYKDLVREIDYGGTNLIFKLNCTETFPKKSNLEKSAKKYLETLILQKRLFGNIVRYGRGKEVLVKIIAGRDSEGEFKDKYVFLSTRMIRKGLLKKSKITENCQFGD